MQQQKTPNEDAEDEWLLSCRCESARAIFNLLACLESVANSSSAANSSSFVATSKSGDALSQSRRRSRKQQQQPLMQPVTVFCSPTSLTFHAYGKAKHTQASVDIPSSIFSDYRVSSQQQQQDEHEKSSGNSDTQDWQAGGEFCVNLTTVLECLTVLGGSSSSNSTASAEHDRTQLACSYNLSQEIFKLELLQHDVLCTAAIPGMQLPDDYDLGNSLALAFRSSPMVARLIVQSTSLQQVLFELDAVPGAAIATVSLGVDGLAVAVVGHWGECQVSIPAKGSHVVSFEVPEQQGHQQLQQPRNYQLHSLQASFQGLDIAQETCLTMNAQGMLAVQHQVVDAVVGNGNPCFVDHILCCLNDDDDDDDEEANSQEEEPQQAAYRRRRNEEYVDVQSTRNNSLSATQQPDSDSPTATWRQTAVTRDSDEDDDGNNDIVVIASKGDDTLSPPPNRKVSSLSSSPNSLLGGRGVSHPEDSDSDYDDDDEDNYQRTSATRLFGRLPVQSTPSSSGPSRMKDRSVRQRTAIRPSHSHSRQNNHDEDDDDDDDERSHNLLEDGSYNDGADESVPELDVAAPLASRAASSSRGDECSSPELVYGKQNM